MKKFGGVRHWVIFAAAFIVVALVAAFGIPIVFSSRPDLPQVNTVESNSTFVVGLPNEPSSLDIRTNDEISVDQALLENVYETLVKRSNDNELKPGLAQSWEVSSDSLTYTFHLHDNMSFSNGDTLDSSDVVWSIDRVLSGKYVGYENLGNISLITNPDRNTVVIQLKSPNPRLLRALSERPGIVYDRRQDATVDYATTALGSGPFVVQSFNNSSLFLGRNPNYWSTKALASQIELRYYSSETALVDDLDNNMINMALPTSATSLQRASVNPTFTVNTGYSMQRVLLGFNCDAGSPLSDQHIRQAVRYAIDAAQIAKDQNDAKEQLSGPISNMFPGYEDLNGLFPYDPAKAREYMSYFPEGYEGTLDVLFPHRYQELGNTVKKYLEDAGFSVNLEILNQATLDERVAAGEYTMALMVMYHEYDYTDFLDANSVFHYQNGQAQDEYNAAISSPSESEYSAHLANFARIISQDAASAWLYLRKDFVVTKARLHGYPTNMTGYYLPLAELDR